MNGKYFVENENTKQRLPAMPILGIHITVISIILSFQTRPERILCVCKAE